MGRALMLCGKLKNLFPLLTQKAAEIYDYQGVSMTSLTEVAKNFAESAKQQRARTDQDVKQEFKRLSDAIKKESASVEATYKNDMKGQHYKTVIWQTFSMIPILAAFGLGIGIMFFLSSHLAIVKVTSLDNGSQWYHCEQFSENKDWCMVKEAN
jgi:hypothetical protein